MATAFEVSEVESNLEPLKALDARAAIESYLDHEIEAWGARTPQVIPFGFHPFVAASHLAFAEHRDLVLSPDAIWLLLVQGFASHVAAHSEALRPQLVSHEGKILIAVINNDLRRGDPSSPWHDVFPVFSETIRECMGEENHDLLVPTFSTTGQVERCAAEIVLMDVVKSYFDFMVVTRCGIPRVHLEGTTEDWEQIRARAARFAEFDLEAWTHALLPVLDQFVAASRGEVAEPFWRSYYKKDDSSGGPYITGWINTLFPYTAEGRSRFSDLGWREAASLGSWEGVTTYNFPSGLSKVPFVWDYFGTKIPMEFLAGFVGATQDSETGALRPEIGWAVREPRDDASASRKRVPPEFRELLGE